MDVGVFKDKTRGTSLVKITPLVGTGLQSFEIAEGNQAAFDPQSLQSGPVETNPVSNERMEKAERAMESISDVRNESGGGGSNPAGANDQTKEMTQGEFALLLVKEAGALRQLPAAADAQDAIDFLRKLGIVPEGGWDIDAPVTDEFLRNFLGGEGEGLSREELLRKIQDLVASRFNNANPSVFRAGSASGSAPA